jgi:transposase
MDAKDRRIHELEAELHEARSQHAATTEQFARTLEEKNQLIASLERHIRQLLRTVRGSRQERIDPDQLLLFSVDELQQLAKELEQAAATPEPAGDESVPETEQDAAKPRNVNHNGRRRLPVHLPREIQRHELPAEQRPCPCCGEQRTEFGVETSEQLEFVPASWKVIEHQRVKYACPKCQENVVVATKPAQPIEKGVPGPGLCAYSVLSKFGDHLPLYREEDIHSRTGWVIRRSTICGWLCTLGLLVEPLVLRMKHLILQSKVIHTDDTKIKMLETPICREAKFWPYQGDWLHPYVVFDFTLDRKRYGPQKFLSGYQGYLQADAYAGFDCVYAPGLVKEVACWVHARRYWHQAVDSDTLRANTALGFIARLSQIESQLRESYPAKNLAGERDFDAIAQARQKYSVPILAEFKGWMERELSTGRILPKSDIRSAFTYTLNQWPALCRYTEQGYLSMDNNAAERLVKFPAIGRGNFLFVGNERAGRNAANFYSLVTGAKLNGVEPFAWLKDLFTHLPSFRDGEAFRQAKNGEPVISEELDQLLPDRWLDQHPDHRWTIDAIRHEERHQKEKARRRNRHRRRRSPR